MATTRVAHHGRQIVMDALLLAQQMEEGAKAIREAAREAAEVGDHYHQTTIREATPQVQYARIFAVHRAVASARYHTAARGSFADEFARLTWLGAAYAHDVPEDADA